MQKNGKRKRITHHLLIIAGFTCLVLGGIGIILPVLPTTPFVLLAAACFSLSSPALAGKLEESRIFGSYLRHWRTNEGVPLRTKVRAIVWLWLGLALSAAIVRTVLVITILAVIGTIVTLHLILIKTRKEAPDEVLTTTGNDP
ncbi:MAG: YbaN family protein [Sphaerochaetaceae bacterium]|jgi:uncharacterized membrane protein YbaN (DUF454 family)|nr:YbaN family protein [Sphaerochaetaceae bacterium]MDX9940273.1 YbaN family protein [Sphaerochaetaceae bacterium]